MKGSVDDVDNRNEIRDFLTAFSARR